MHLRILIFVLLCLCVPATMAQGLRFGDLGFFSIDKPFPEKEQPPFIPVFQFDGQNMFVGSRSVRLGGIKAGVRHRDTGISAGLGFYAFTNRLITKNAEVPNYGALTTVESDFGLMNLFVEPRIFSNKRFLVSVPVSVGYGNIEQYYTSILGTLRPYRKLTLTSFAVKLNGEFNLFYWLGAGVGIGYHHFGTSDKRVQSDYSGFVYDIKLKIDIIDIYKTVSHHLNK